MSDRHERIGAPLSDPPSGAPHWRVMRASGHAIAGLLRDLGEEAEAQIVVDDVLQFRRRFLTNAQAVSWLEEERVYWREHFRP
jgi:hypothetical protein